MKLRGELSELSALGEDIRAARTARKLTQAQLADAVGLSRQTLTGLEQGTVKDLGIRKILRVLEHLNLSLAVRPKDHPVTLDDLLRERERESAKGTIEEASARSTRGQR